MGGMNHYLLNFVKTSYMYHNISCSPVCTFHTCSPGRNLYIHMTLFHCPLKSNSISLQFHSCMDLDYIVLRSEVMLIRCCKSLPFSYMSCESSTLVVYLLAFILFGMIVRIVLELLSYLFLMPRYIKHNL